MSTSFLPERSRRLFDNYKSIFYSTYVKQSWRWYVYIIECLDSSYYVGRTWKTELRYDQHVSGLGGKYTAEHGVKRLAYVEEFDNYEQASLREKQLKGWTRAKKEMLIKGIWNKDW